MSRKGDKKGKSSNKPTENMGGGIEIISFARESVAPIVSERIQRSKPWVFWGGDNLYPNDLIRMADNSALHSAILNTKAKMIAGDGIIFDGNKAESILEAATEEWGGLNKTIEQIATDVAFSSSLNLNVQFDRAKKIHTIKHSDFSYLRSGKMDLETRRVQEYWHSTRWDLATNKRNYSKDDEIYKPIEMLAFNTDRRNEEVSKLHGQIITSKRYSPSVLYYAKPSYLGATNYIDVAAKIANFHKSQLDNGMMGNMHIHLKQDLTDPKKRIGVLKELNEQYAGTENAGRILLTYGVGETNIPIVTQIQSNDAHQQLALLNDKVNQEIVSAHGIPRVLTQLDVKSGLGGLETTEAIDMFQTLQITPEQQLIEDTFNKILKFNGVDEKIKIEPLTPSSLILSDELMKLSTTVNEMREIRKTEPLEEADERGSKLLIELEENGTRSDTSDKERPSKD